MRGRRGEKENKMGKKLIGIMLVLLMIGCGQQTDVASGGKSLSEVLLEVGRSTEKAFYSFIELISDTLGFRVNAETKRSEVGSYFSSLGTKIGEASKELEEVVKKTAGDGDKDGLLGKAIKEAVEAAKATLSSLKTHLEALKDIGDGDNGKVGEVGSNSQQGVAAAEPELKKAYGALKGIVEIAKKEGVETPKKSDLAVDTAKVGGTTPENGAKVLASGANAGGAAGPGATTIVSAVSGEAILAAIVESAEGDAAGAIGKAADGTTSALKFARGDSTANNLAKTSALAGAVSGGIALRSLVKEGRLAYNSGNNDEKAVTLAGITAVNKLLGAIENIITNTVKNVIGKAKTKMDEARATKTVGQK